VHEPAPGPDRLETLPQLMTTDLVTVRICPGVRGATLLVDHERKCGTPCAGTAKGTRPRGP
jgi:hypothetical protein